MRGMRSAAKQPEPAKRAEATNLKQTLAMLWPYLWQFKYRVVLALLALLLLPVPAKIPRFFSLPASVSLALKVH